MNKNKFYEWILNIEIIIIVAIMLETERFTTKTFEKDEKSMIWYFFSKN